MNYYNDFYHFGKIIGEYQFATSSCYSKKEVNEMDKVIYLNIDLLDVGVLEKEVVVVGNIHDGVGK